MKDYYAKEHNGLCTFEDGTEFMLSDLCEFIHDKGINKWFDEGRKIEISPYHFLDDNENWPLSCEMYYKEIICSNIEMYNEDFRDGCIRLKNKSVDFIFLDLPYGTTKNKWDVVIPFDEVWGVIDRILKKNGVVVFTGAGLFTAQVILSNPKMYKYSLVWEKTHKTNFLNSKKQFLRSHEDIVVFYHRQPVFRPIITSGHKRKISTKHHSRNSKITTNYNDHSGSEYDSTERYSGSVLRYSNDKQKSSINPTQKPVALIEQLIQVYTDEGDLICDFTAGSFSSAVAAKNIKRKYIGFEIDKIQYEKAIERLR